MAVDTRNKRASAITIGIWWRNLMPTPNASSDTSAERAQLAGVYSGYEPTWTPIGPGPGGGWSGISAGPSGGWSTISNGPSGGWTTIP